MSAARDVAHGPGTTKAAAAGRHPSRLHRPTQRQQGSVRRGRLRRVSVSDREDRYLAATMPSTMQNTRRGDREYYLCCPSTQNSIQIECHRHAVSLPCQLPERMVSLLVSPKTRLPAALIGPVNGPQGPKKENTRRKTMLRRQPISSHRRHTDRPGRCSAVRQPVCCR